MWSRENNKNKLNLSKLIINNQKIGEEIENKHQLIASLENTELAHAIYRKKNNNFYLDWLETKENFQGSGVASKILDFLCTEAINANGNLIINAMDENVIDVFYFRWFQKRVDPDNRYENKVKKHFNSLVENGSVHSTLILTLDDLQWTPEAKQMTNSC